LLLIKGIYVYFLFVNFFKSISSNRILTGIFSGLFAGGFIIQELTPVARNALVYLSVWTFFTFMILWLIGQGIYFWKKR